MTRPADRISQRDRPKADPRRRWLPASCLAIAIALATAGWQAWIYWSPRNPKPDVITPVGNQVGAHGATFRIDDVRVGREFPSAQGDATVTAPKRAVIVLVIMTTEIVDESLPGKDNLCETTLIDPAGRSWRTESDISFDLKRPEAVSCTGTLDRRIRPHRPLRVGFSFVIPADAADDFDIRLALPRDDAYLIEFTR